MQIKQPQPFTFEAGKRAVLLLHGFTGHSADVRMLGRFLEKKGYTSHAPIYKGHGVPPEQLINTTASDWWKDAINGYDHLQELGYEEIAVAGLSLGGILSLKIASERPVKAVMPICTPIYFDNVKRLMGGFKQFAKEYKQLERKEQQDIANEIDALVDQSEKTFDSIGKLIQEVQGLVDQIYAPALVMQAGDDELINADSAHYIYDHIQSDRKELKWYEGAPHVITLSDYKDEVHEDVYAFLEKLDWKES